MNKSTMVFLSVTGGFLSGLAWMNWCSGLILLVSFVPFFIIENHIYDNPKKYYQNSFFTYLLPGFVIFCIMTIGWIRVISITAAVCIIIVASFLLSLTMWIAHIVRLKTGSVPAGFISLTAFWLTLEFLCLRINVLSPWINLGNGLAKDILFIQWYEITGASGGTLWILASNCLLALTLICSFKKARIRSCLIIWLFVVTIPAAMSVIRYTTITPSPLNDSEIVIVQPQIDPYKDKFRIPFEQQLEKTIRMLEPAIDEKSAWAVMPETLIDDPVNEDRLSDDKYIKTIRKLTERHQQLSVITGLVSYKPDAHTGSGQYFNSAFKIDTGKTIEIYHKSKLVPGFEDMNANGLLRIINKLLPELGGTNAGFGRQFVRTCFTGKTDSLITAPVICYESVFGEFVNSYIRKGAEAIIIITNDGWWKNSNGYKHHLSYASLRAIETRRPVIRAANTGVSCFIDFRGKIKSRIDWWIPGILKGQVSPENRITPYVRYGDYLQYTACLLSTIILVYVFIFRPQRYKNRRIL